MIDPRANPADVLAAMGRQSYPADLIASDFDERIAEARDYLNQPITLEEAHGIANPPAAPKPPPNLTPIWVASGAAFAMFGAWSWKVALVGFVLCFALSFMIRAAFRKRRR